MKDQKGTSFSQQLMITIIDKLFFALVLLIVGFFLNKKITSIEHANTKLVEEIRQKANDERLASSQGFEVAMNKLNQQYANQQREFEQMYQKEREDFIRREDRSHEERMEEIKNQQNVQLEILKSANNVNSALIEKSIYILAEAWLKLNAIGQISRIVESSDYQKERDEKRLDLIRLVLDTENKEETISSIIDYVYGTGEGNSKDKYREWRIFLESGPHGETLPSMIQLIGTYETPVNKLREEFIQLYMKKFVVVDVNEQIDRIIAARAFIEENEFWIKPEFYVVMNEYLDTHEFIFKDGMFEKNFNWYSIKAKLESQKANIEVIRDLVLEGKY